MRGEKSRRDEEKGQGELHRDMTWCVKIVA